MTTAEVKIQCLGHYQGLPLIAYQTSGAAGFDFYAAVEEPMTLKAGTWDMIPTGLKIGVPCGMELQVRPRSGLACKYGVTVLNSPGTIDSDYRGEVKVILINLGKEDFVIERGMRIAQGVFAPNVTGDFQVVSTLDDTSRGEGGFGHTGV